jgi:hypothetical protein
MTPRRSVLLAVLLALALAVVALLPPNPVQVPAAAPAPAHVRGVIHVHTRRSDGTGTLDSVAAAAARAGLQFVIVTDHGDGTREPEAPSYRSGVLCIDAVEISTDEGHLVALDLPVTTYVLGGEARDVVEDVRRLGGFAIAAHPDSARADLRWTASDTSVDGLEWINGDSQWRDESWPSLVRALMTYPLRPAATLTALMDRPVAELSRWDALAARHRVVAVPGSDAHARLGFGVDPYDEAFALPIPSYEQVFRVMSMSLPGVSLSGSAREDARSVIDAIRRGELYSTIDGLGAPVGMTMSATPVAMTTAARIAERTVGIGGELPRPAEIQVDAFAPGAEIVLLRNGEEVASSASDRLVFSASVPGAYRAEIRRSAAEVPWIVSNPIYVGLAPAPPHPAQAAAIDRAEVYSDGPATGWRVEKSAASEGVLNIAPGVEGPRLSLRYGLGGTRSEGPYVALVTRPDAPVRAFTRLTLSGQASRPMRLSVQFRAPDGGMEQRWRRSVFLDENARTVTVAFDDMKPVGSATGSPEAGDLLFVVDTVNAAPGASGQFWIDDVRFER